MEYEPQNIAADELFIYNVVVNDLVYLTEICDQNKISDSPLKSVVKLKY